jgi:hypothetical protein
VGRADGVAYRRPLDRRKVIGVRDRIRITLYISKKGYERLKQYLEMRKNLMPGHHTLSSITDELYWSLPLATPKESNPDGFYEGPPPEIKIARRKPGPQKSARRNDKKPRMTKSA